MRILFVNQVFYPDVAATSQYLLDMAQFFTRQGHNVSVLTAQQSYSNPKAKFSKFEVYQNICIFRIRSFSFGKSSKWGRILDALSLNVLFAWRLLWLPKFDAVVSLTSPPLVACFIIWIARCRGSLFFQWMMDMQLEASLEAEWFLKSSLIIRCLESLIRLTLKKTDHLIVLDSFMQQRILRKGVEASKITVIPPWPLDDLELKKSTVFKSRHALSNKFIVMYSGNHNICHPLDTLLQAALLLKTEEDIRFVFIGGGERVKDVQYFKTLHRLENILQLPYQDRADLKYSLSAADVHVVVMGEHYSGIVHPCKIYGILALGKPFIFIGPRESPIGRMIEQDKVGYHLNHDDSEGLVRVLKSLSCLSLSEKEDIQQREQAVAERFSQKRLMPQLAETILRTTEKSS